MDYRDIMNLMYIANNEIWFNPDNKDIYCADAVRGSEDTWNRFWELVELNGGVDSCSDVLQEVLPIMADKDYGKNWYYDGYASIDWFENVGYFLEEQGYPMYLDYLRKYEIELDNDEEYQIWLSRSNEKMNELYQIYYV